MFHFSQSNAVTLSLVIFSTFTLISNGGEIESTTVVEACEDRSITIVERLGLRISTGNSKTQTEIMCEENTSIQNLSSALDSNYVNTTRSDQDFRLGLPEINTSESNNGIGLDRLDKKAVSGFMEAVGIRQSNRTEARPLPGYRIVVSD